MCQYRHEVDKVRRHVERDMLREGWVLYDCYYCDTMSWYLFFVKSNKKLRVRVSSHPPHESWNDGISIHVGGHTRDDLIQRARDIDRGSHHGYFEAVRPRNARRAGRAHRRRRRCDHCSAQLDEEWCSDI